MITNRLRQDRKQPTEADIGNVMIIDAGTYLREPNEHANRKNTSEIARNLGRGDWTSSVDGYDKAGVFYLHQSMH